MTAQRTFAGCVLFAVTALFAGAAAVADDLAEAVARVRVVPRHNQWTLVTPEQRAVLAEIVRMSVTQRDELLRSTDPRLRGIGIFIVEQQGDLARLLSLAGLLADDAPTVPYAAPAAHGTEYPMRSQTVGDYLSTVYGEWFGVDADKSKERFEELLGSSRDRPEDLVQPWVVRLRRAAPDERAVAKLKAQIAELRDAVRWAVVTLAHHSGLYTRAEARALLLALPEPRRAELRAGVNPLPHEPLFRSAAFFDATRRAYEDILGP